MKMQSDPTVHNKVLTDPTVHNENWSHRKQQKCKSESHSAHWRYRQILEYTMKVQRDPRIHNEVRERSQNTDECTERFHSTQ